MTKNSKSEPRPTLSFCLGKRGGGRYPQLPSFPTARRQQGRKPLDVEPGRRRGPSCFAKSRTPFGSRSETGEWECGALLTVSRGRSTARERPSSGCRTPRAAVYISTQERPHWEDTVLSGYSSVRKGNKCRSWFSLLPPIRHPFSDKGRFPEYVACYFQVKIKLLSFKRDSGKYTSPPKLEDTEGRRSLCMTSAFAPDVHQDVVSLVSTAAPSVTLNMVFTLSLRRWEPTSSSKDPGHRLWHRQ